MFGRAPVRGQVVALAAVAVLAGCHAFRHTVTAMKPFAAYPEPLPPPPLAELPLTRPLPIQPDAGAVAPLDPRTERFAARDRSGLPFRQLLEDDCERLARDAAPLRSGRPDAADCSGHCGAEGGAFWREARQCLAAEARNKAVADAFESYYRLADAEARREAALEMLAGIDELRGVAKEARTVGVASPLSADDLDRQRGALVTLLTEADLGSDLLTIDLKRRLGLDGRTSDRPWPVGVFAVAPERIEPEVAVAEALAKRGDLRLLRIALRRLTPETVAGVRDLLRERIAGAVPDPLAGSPLLRRAAEKREPAPKPGVLDAAVHAEVLELRQALADALAARERQVEAEVRAALRTLDARQRQVALARGAFDRRQEVKAEAKERGPMLSGAAKLEAEKSRAELAAAAFAWHQARAKLRAARGDWGGDEPGRGAPLEVGATGSR